MSSPKIAIIGAGMAGITAARTLVAAGQNVQLFEKSRGSGGRLASKRSEMGRINLGAQAFTCDDADFLTELQLWQQQGWVTQSTHQQSQWTGIPYMSALTRHLLAQIDTHFACEIQALSYDSKGWLLHDQHAQTHGPFCQLIVAIPAPQAATLLKHCALALAEQAACVSMQPAWILALGFKQPLTVTKNLAQLRSSSIAEITCTPPSSEHPLQTWRIRASAQWSTLHLEDQHQHIIAALSKDFAAVLEIESPVADSVFAHRWRYAIGALPVPTTLLADLQRGLYLTGDWCICGDVQSAWQSGQRAALQLLSAAGQQPG
ncbi:MAG: NAD(P)-binding protein [Gammaproteobacteria bacterium]|nr:NAD(P)-binding protein [Gammaproteobacteria bacterium]